MSESDENGGPSVRQLIAGALILIATYVILSWLANSLVGTEWGSSVWIIVGSVVWVGALWSLGALGD